MGAMLKIAALIDGNEFDSVVEMSEIDTVQCAYHSSNDDIKEVGRRGKVMIDTKSSNRISVDTGVGGEVIFALADPNFKNSYAVRGIDGILMLRTTYHMCFNSEERFSQYVLGKGGYVPSNTDDASEQKSEQSL